MITYGFAATELTPRVRDISEIRPGQRATLDGVRVLYRCLMGHLLYIGRPWAIGQSLNDVHMYGPCVRCHEQDDALA